MTEFLKLNKEFLIKSYYWISGLPTTGFSLYLYFFYKDITLYWIVIILILTILILPIFVLGVWSYDWYRKRKYIKYIQLKLKIPTNCNASFTCHVIAPWRASGERAARRPPAAGRRPFGPRASCQGLVFVRAAGTQQGILQLLGVGAEAVGYVPEYLCGLGQLGLVEVRQFADAHALMAWCDELGDG